jgi:hypothetical protein
MKNTPEDNVTWQLRYVVTHLPAFWGAIEDANMQQELGYKKRLQYFYMETSKKDKVNDNVYHTLAVMNHKYSILVELSDFCRFWQEIVYWSRNNQIHNLKLINNKCT